jgi:hypothetical protein
MVFGLQSLRLAHRPRKNPATQRANKTLSTDADCSINKTHMERSKLNGGKIERSVNSDGFNAAASECDIDAVETESISSEVLSWEALANLLAGFAPEDIEHLAAARELESVYPLLHALTRGALGDFFVRIAALEALIADGRSPLTPTEIEEVLYWLKDNTRDLVMRTLRGSGWVTYRAADGYRISSAGQFVATVLSFLRAQVRQGDLLPTIEGIDYMIRLGVDPVRQVLLLRSRLEDLRSLMEEARNSHSEVILRGATARLSEALEVSERIREVLTRVPLEMMEARRVAQDVHDLLSRLHGVGSDLHAAITEVGRQYLHLVAGLTSADIVTTLMQLSVDELGNAAKCAMQPIFRRPVFVVPELLASSAEAYLTRAQSSATPPEWTEPPDPESTPNAIHIPEEIVHLLDDLDRLVRSQRTETLATFVPRRTAPESLLRASLLPLLGNAAGGEGVAGRLGAMPLKLQVEAGGRLTPAVPLSQLSEGVIGTDLGDQR